MRTYRTDLAMEAFDGEDQHALNGVSINQWESGGVTLTEVVVEDEDGAKLLSKPIGRYLTLECAGLRRRDPDVRAAMATLLSEELARLLPREGETLVIGLGNRSITPDALGPAVIDRTLVTRHLNGLLGFASDMRPVSALAPGVMGVTGIETMDLVECLAHRLRPSAVICIDSLAARGTGRVGTTIQVTDTGIQPGAGVGNHRRALTAQGVGAPIIAIGMPTVIYAATLACDAVIGLCGEGDNEKLCGDSVSEMEQKLLGGELGEMIVTPREIDTLIRDAAEVIAQAINRALQPDLTPSDIAIMLE